MHTVKRSVAGDWRIYLHGIEVLRGYGAKDMAERIAKNLDEVKRKRDEFYGN